MSSRCQSAWVQHRHDGYASWWNGLISAGLVLAGVLLCWALVRENEAEGTGDRGQGTEVESLVL
jgi:hypothetical protein